MNTPLYAVCLASALAAAPQRPQEFHATMSSFALVENRGQWDTRALYRTQKGSAIAWFVRDGWILDVAGRKHPRSERAPAQGEGSRVQPAPRNEVAGVAIRMRFVGARGDTEGVDRLPGHFNFFRGAEPSGWRSAVPAFGRVRYASLYRGVDLVVRSGSGVFAYDLHLDAGIDPATVVVRCEGMQGLEVADGGCLVLKTAVGEIRQTPPVAWHVQPDGRRTPVACRYVDHGSGTFGFAVADWSEDVPLVIDPDLDWGTYFGGTGWEDCMAISKAPGASATSLLTVCGPTRSTNLPTTMGPRQQGGMDVFVARFDPSQAGTGQRVWATLIGGDLDELAYDVQQDLLGRATVVGVTQSSGSGGSQRAFPTIRALQPKFGGGRLDGFVMQLDRTGALAFSTFLGGGLDDRVCKVKITGGFALVLAGFTDSFQSVISRGFPVTANAFQPRNAGGQDVFIARLAGGGQTLAYSTYVGGAATEGHPYNPANPAWYDMSTMGLDVDSGGRVLFGARTWSTNYPRKKAFQARRGSANDAFLTILDPSLRGTAQLVYSTFLGGTSHDIAENALFEPNRPGVIVSSGVTWSRDFVTSPGAFDGTHNGGATHNDVFVTWLDTAKIGSRQLDYSTFLGGSQWDGPSQMEIDSCGVANLGGWCGPGFPTTPSAIFRRPMGFQDGWFARLAPRRQGARDLIYSTYLGGPPGGAGSYVGGLVLDGVGGVFVSGSTSAAPFPTPNGAYKTLKGSRDGFVQHLWGLNEGVRAFGGSTPTVCARRLALGARSTPARGNARFQLSTWGAQANAPGFLGIGLPPPPASFRYCGATLYFSPLIVFAIRANRGGEHLLPSPIPKAILRGLSVLAQGVFANSGCCITATNGLQIVVRW